MVVTPRHSSRVVDLALELEAAPPSRAVLVRVVNVQPRRQGLPVGPVAGRTYDVSISSRRILRAAPPLSESELSDADAPCYRQLFGASHECRGCPVASLEGASARSACVVVPTPGEGAHRCGQPWAVLAYSERIDGKTVRVTYVPVDQSLYSALVDRRIDSLVENPALTTREREVLRFILNCADEAELASRLGVSTRTVKFHQMNLLRKLKLDSKAALFALLR
ncbi:MAG: helix-turn-helix transcriptional regulator [Myxococcota bacterium]